MISSSIWIKTGTQLKIWDNLPNIIKFGCIITQTIINGGDRFDFCPENSMPYDQCCSIKIIETRDWKTSRFQSLVSDQKSGIAYPGLVDSLDI